MKKNVLILIVSLLMVAGKLAGQCVTVGSDQTVCQGSSAISLGGAVTNGTTTVLWSGGGANGSFSNPSDVNSTWTPIGSFSGSVTLTLTSTAGCANPTKFASLTITVLQTPTASISGTASVCEGAISPNITFTNTLTADITVTYNINGGTPLTIDVNASSTATVAAPTTSAGSFVYNLVSVAYKTGTACSSSLTGSATITVNPVPGSISGTSNVCAGSNTAAFTCSPGGGSWYSSSPSVATVGASTGIVHGVAAGTCVISYVLPVTGCYSTAIVTVNPASAGGIIAGSATVCTGTNSTILNLSGNTGNIIDWQSSAGDFTTNTSLANISSTYTAVNLTSTTNYRAVIQSGACPVAYSGIATVTVDNASAAGSIGIDATVCSGSNSTPFTLATSTGNVVKWQYSTNNWSSVGDIANVTLNLTATNLTSTTKYRAVVKNGVCPSVVSTDATVTVDPISVGGTIAGSTDVCSGTNNTVLTLSGYTGSIVKWQYYTDNWYDIVNSTATHTAINLTETTKYRAVIQSGTVCSSVNSAEATITYYPASAGGTSASNQTICSGSLPADITLTGQTGVVVKWQKSPILAFTTPVDIASTSTTLTGAVIGPLTADTYFRAVVQSGTCSVAYSSVTTIFVRTVPTATISGTVAVCKDDPTAPNITFTNPQSLPVTITYNINGVTQPTIGVAASTFSTLPAPTAIAGTFAYSLENVYYTTIPTCSNNISGTATVTVKPLPVPTITGPLTPRVTSTGKVYTTESGKSSYVWNLASGGTITSGAGTNSIQVDWTGTGSRTLSVTYASGGCSAAAPTNLVVDVKPLPVASGVTITGTAEVGKLLVGSYTYTDGAGYDEGPSTYEWYRDVTTPLSVNSKTYYPVAGDDNHTLSFEVTPISSSPSPNTGAPKKSAPTGTVSSSDIPVASEVCINRAGLVLTGRYNYTFSAKAEGTSTFRWLRDGSEVDNTLTHTLVAADTAYGVSLVFEVTPKSLPSVKTGLPVQSYPLARFTMPLDTYSESIDSVALAANPMGGIFSGPGVTNGIFSPKAVGWSATPYLMKYLVNIVNPTISCSQKAYKKILVTQASTSFAPLAKPVICRNDGNLTITVQNIPVGARLYNGYGFFFNWDVYRFYDWYGDYYYWYHSYLETDPRIVSQTPDAGVPYGVPFADYGSLPYADDATTPWSVTIDPSKLTPGNGNDILYLYYFYNDYYYLLEMPLNVESNVTVNRINNINSQYCTDAGLQNISVDITYPTGASALWTGSILSVTGQPVAQLDPSSQPPSGTPYTVTYQYSSPTGCLSNILTQNVTINPLPDPSFTLDPTYNIDSSAVTLIPVLPAGGSFTGNGVSANILFPSLAGTGLDVITYNIKDANLCSNTLTQSTTIRKAQGTIIGLPAVVCYRDTTYTVTATGLPPGITALNFTNKKKSIVYSPGPASFTASYNIVAARSGVDTLVFSYLWDNVDYAITTVVNIDSIGLVRINNLFPGDIVCANLAPFELFTSPSGGVFAGPVSGAYLDPTKAMGLTSVSYTYTNIKSQCSATTVVPFKITPAPAVSFTPKDVCIENSSDTTFFINNTVSVDSVSLWLWEFSDPTGTTTSNKRTPGYLYNTGSFHSVTLTATTVNKCVSGKTSTIDLGVRPLADFYWKNECFSKNDSIMLFDTAFSASPIISRNWKFPDSGPPLSGKTAKYPKKSTGYLPVTYIVKTSYANCADTITKNIYIRPTISLATDDYFENFEKGNGNWVKGEETVNSWSFGTPSRSIINNAASGQNAWYTNYDLTNQKVESSSIVSPCFDFSESVRPMIRLKTWKRFEMNRDGAALQYKIGDAPAWQYIGSLDDGINWYNSTLIKGRPGGDQIGWTTIAAPDTKWIESRHSLDELKGKKNVKFRIAYGSDGTSQNNDGIAFDDISIEERTRNVLLEHFTNNSSLVSSEATAMIDAIDRLNDNDIINIQYHTNFPGVDSFYVNNPGDASARILFYGLTKTPYTFVDGGTRKDYASIFDYSNREIDGSLVAVNSNDIVRRSLLSPVFNIKLDSLIVSGGVLTIGVEIVADKDTSLSNLTLYLAVIEKSNSKFSGAAGETVFRNVFRKFIPDAAGINLAKTWTKGVSVPVPDQTWIIQKTLNSSDIEVVAFIQNNVTKEIYQAQSMLKPKITVGIEKPGILNNIDFALYPNPAKHQLTIGFGEMLDKDTDIFIYDFGGNLIRTYKAGSGETEFTIDDLGLKDGIYLIKVSSGGASYGFKKLIISGS